MIRSPADYMAEWKFGSGHTKTTGKQRVNQEPRSAHGRAVNNLSVAGWRSGKISFNLGPRISNAAI